MKTQLVISAAAACFCLVSCATDPAATEKKQSVSIGRFGVSQNVAVENAAAEAPAQAPTVAAAPGPVEKVTPPVAEEPEKKGFFARLFGKKDKTEDAPAAVQVQEKKPEAVKAPAPVEFAEPAKKKPLSDDIRLPNMLGMPEEKDLKATNPPVKKDGGDGAVISRPPVEKKAE